MTTGVVVTLVALESDRTALSAMRAATADGQMTLLGCVDNLPALLDIVAEKHPAVVLIDLSETESEPSMAVRAVLGASPESCVVVTGADVSPAVISRAVSAGARGFILRPFAHEELANTIRDAHGNFAELRRLQRGDSPSGNRRGTIIAVYSPKGGVGCTTIATNLSVALATRSKLPVALIDLDLQFGDVGVSLDLRSANSVIDLVTHEEEIDAEFIDDVFVKHESGVRALVSPDHVGSAETANPERIVHAVEELRDHFAFVVCDLWSSLDDLTLGMLRSADHIVLVTTPEVPALKNIRRVLGATTLLNDERTQIVLNRHPGKVGVSIADVERNLGRRVSATIPSEGIGVTDAINQGISMFDSRARVRASRSYLRLAERFLNEGGSKGIRVAVPAQA
ncbi:MAG TPA: AAA family ATPase [Methylomirabilota bacterium]|nr:AAA family ATPase [Methylomirabilota bacterium]